MCNCENTLACSCGSLITTNKGNKGDTGTQGPQGIPGENGADGMLDWETYDISCWVSNGITNAESTNDEISQDFIDAFCEMYQRVNIEITANNDYTFTNKNEVVYINPILNDIFFPSVTVTITSATNGTATVDVDNHTVIFTPATDFVGTATIVYKITDSNGNFASAAIYVTVNDVASTEQIETTIENTLITLLQSNEYWDIGLPIGTKLLISNINLPSFTTSGITAGKGIAGTKWAKWAICNGNLANGVDDFRLRNLRGFDYADGAGNDVAGFKAGSDTKSIDITNLPPHRHKYFDAFVNAVDGSSTVFSSEVDSHASSEGVDQGSIYTGNAEITEGTGSNRDSVWYDRNTSDGTNNINDQDELQSTPDPLNVVNAYTTVIVVQKIA